jgi:hypothetical protein
MSSDKRMLDLPDNLGELTDEEMERLVDKIYGQLVDSDGE